MNPVNELITGAAGAIDAASQSLQIGIEELDNDDATHQDVAAVMAVTQNLALLAIARTLLVIAVGHAQPEPAGKAL